MNWTLTYDVPQDVIDHPPSPAFRRFLVTRFGGARVFFSERLRVANDLAPDEVPLARQLIRSNLKSRHSHIISGTWVLRDLDAVPLLRSMLHDEPDKSRRLVIAGALWKLNQDPVFIECLNRAKETGLLAVYFHLVQILWLNDERAIDFLIDLLPETDEAVQHARKLRQLDRFFSGTPLRCVTTRLLKRFNDAQGATLRALSLLNHLETGHLVHPDATRLPSYYKGRRDEPAFREMMVAAVHKAVAEMHQGR